ncbi:hypothetical protein EW026_g1508 [Hermanssonia centrifuga]|uniref:Uncharacterized protein n=1 Tax=Hermanssonia centrifuga TaxID=98765 RepID=A0A4S4KRP6_9APHY|nr:hypothetical protein EW026_g1508 [Hermanssonia centrifuga]
MPETGVNQWPPPSPILAEGELQSALRTQEEKEAKRINDEIDRQIELERQELKKRKPQAKILLLGQSEAGKSTLLKNFQLHFAPKAFEADGEAWRAVIHLNLVRAVNFILEALATSPPPPPPSVTTESDGVSAAWAPYFDDVNAMIFLCPMANFDRVLAEDPTVNSLLDSFQIWKTICESKLLADATFILFLNKMDLLKVKLNAGIVFSEYVSLYKDQPNDADYIAQYFKRKFSAVHKHSSPKARALHIHTSCAIDTATMSTILTRVKDVILWSILKDMTMV